MTFSDDPTVALNPGDVPLPADLARRLLIPDSDNLVARPWGGTGLQAFKGLPAAMDPGSTRYGEAFEIAAFDEDREASQFPSRLSLADGSRLTLPQLLREHGEALLGQNFIRRYGACFPLLPKSLSVAELLSVQGHPAGNTEVYIIIDADPGASLRLGFSRDIDAAAVTAQLKQGLAAQDGLIATLGDWIDEAQLQAMVGGWFAQREARDDAIRNSLTAAGVPTEIRESSIEVLHELKRLYWSTLDSMNAIELAAGQVIYNATPQRLLAGTGAIAAAEVHALGNPEGKEILALEIRRPGPTFRAWDNVRFPRRDVDVDAAIAALNLRATTPEDFLVQPVAVPGQPGRLVSVDCEFFRVEHIRPSAECVVPIESSGPHALHCIGGSVNVLNAAGESVGELARGQSALVPIGVGAYQVVSNAKAEVIRVTLPESA